MRYSKILTYDACNCHGYSVTLWVCGCNRHCEGCFNPELWDYNCGKPFTENTYNVIKEKLNQPFISKFVLLGGEPLSDRNRSGSIELLKQIKKDCPHIETVVYTGNTIEELGLNSEEIKGIDFIIDGEFNKELKVKTPQLRGSTNQKCYQNCNGELIDISEKYF